MSRTVCFDTNVLVDLSAVYYNHKEAKQLKRNHYKHYQTLLQILNLIKNEEIKILVLPMVLFEVAEVSMKNNFRTMEFLEKFRDVIKVVSIKNSKIRRQLTVIDNLAETYCKESTVMTRKGKKLTFNPVFRNIQNKPAWDAVIMAQATLVGFPLVTRDWDFLEDHKPVRIRNINNFFVKRDVMPYSCQNFLRELYKVEESIAVKNSQAVFQDEAMAYV